MNVDVECAIFFLGFQLIIHALSAKAKLDAQQLMGPARESRLAVAVTALPQFLSLCYQEPSVWRLVLFSR